MKDWPRTEWKSGDAHSTMWRRMSPRRSRSIGKSTSDDAVRVDERRGERDAGAGQQRALPSRPRAGAVEPAAEQVQRRGTRSRARTCRARWPTPRTAPAARPAGGARPRQSGTSTTHRRTSEEEHAEQQRALRPQRVEAAERGDRQQRGAHPLARQAQREPEREHADQPRPRCPPSTRIAERPERAVERAVEHLGEPRLRDPVHARRGVRVDVVVRDPVVEDVLDRCAGARRTSCRRAARCRRPTRTARRPR